MVLILMILKILISTIFIFVHLIQEFIHENDNVNQLTSIHNSVNEMFKLNLKSWCRKSRNSGLFGHCL